VSATQFAVAAIDQNEVRRVPVFSDWSHSHGELDHFIGEQVK